MANLAGRILAYACGSEVKAVALMDNLINGSSGTALELQRYSSISASSQASACCPAWAWV
jgi:hypothetical protein